MSLHRNFLRLVLTSACLLLPPKTALFGRADPETELPAGAVARLGETQGPRGGAVEAVAFSPDGKNLVSAHRDHTLRLWQTSTGRELGHATGHQQVVLSLVFSADGHTLLTASADHTAGLWDVGTGRRLRKLDRPGERMLAAAYAPDGRPLAWTEDEQHAIRMWDVATGKQIGSFQRHRSLVRSVALSPDGQTLASAGADKIVWLWDVATGKKLRRLRPEENSGLASLAGEAEPTVPVVVKFAPNGWTLACRWDQGSVSLWEPNTGGLIYQIFVNGAPHGHTPLVAFTPDSRILCWDVDPPYGPFVWADAAFFNRVGSERYANDPTTFTCFEFSTDGLRLATGCRDGSVLLWDLRHAAWNQNRPERTLGQRQREEAWDDLAGNDGRKIYTARWILVVSGAEGVAFLRERLRPARAVPAGQVQKLLGQLDDASGQVRAKAFAQLQALGPAAAPELRRTLQGRPSAEVRQKASMLLEGLDRRRQRRGIDVLEQINSPQARQMLHEIAGGSDGAWLTQQAQAALARLARKPIFPAETGTTQQEPKQAQEEAHPLLKFPAAAETMAPRAGPVPRRQAPTTDRLGDPLPPGAVARLGTLRLRHQGRVSAVAFAPDGKMLASGGADNCVRIWESTTGKEIHSLPVKNGHGPAIAYSPDGKRLAAAQWDGTIIIWDTGSGREVDRLQSGLSELGIGAWLGFSPDGTLLAVSMGGQSCVWDAKTGEERSRLAGSGLGFTADAHLLVFQSGALLDGTTGKPVLRLPGATNGFVSRDGKRLVTPDLALWDIVSGKKICELPRFPLLVSPPPSRRMAKRWPSAAANMMSSISMLLTRANTAACARGGIKEAFPRWTSLRMGRSWLLPARTDASGSGMWRRERSWNRAGPKRATCT